MKFACAVALLLAAASGADAQTVEQVLSGDTVIIAGVGKVRLTGIRSGSSPVSVGPTDSARPPRSGPDAPPPPLITGRIRTGPDRAGRDALRSMVLGKRVRLELDEGSRERDEVPRAYLFLDDETLVNAELIRSGRAEVDRSRPFSRLNAFIELEQQARGERRGIWAQTSRP